MAELFTFEWPVDQAGYDLVHRPAHDSGGLLGSWDAYDAIRPRGGPPRYYRPLDNPGLWRRFAETRADAKCALAFINEFGALDEFPEQRVDDLCQYASLVLRVAERIDAEDRSAAAEIYTEYGRPNLTAGIVWDDRKAAFEFKLAPRSLLSAILIQAGEAITGNRRFRRCRNCAVWFLLGPGGHTARREFCSDRCRVAWARRRKRGEGNA
jgi:hypothetical protein